MTKQQLRTQFLKMRAQMSGRPLADTAIGRQLFQSPFYAAAKTVMTYLSYKSEVDTQKIVAQMLADNKTVCAPVCFENGRMDAFAFHSAKELAPSEMGILEPPQSRLIVPDAIDLILVPGCCFNKNGYRIGYGGGYYDRYLARFHGITCGLFYHCLQAEFEPEENDIPLKYIITEQACFEFSVFH